MIRKFQPGRIVIATHNRGKVAEIEPLLRPFGAQCVAAGDLNLREPAEDGDSFLANAIIKARAAAVASGLVALADDSGLCVDALGGRPGVHSARWAGPGKDFYAAMERIRREIGDHEDHAAHFVCALALCWPDGHVETAEGRIHGHLDFPPRGNRGFGYDPIFVPAGMTHSFGEMEPADKEAISHRARAFKLLADKCFR